MTESLLYSHESSIPYNMDRTVETGEVVCHLSHELRQPLSTLEASAYYLKLILAGNDPRVDHQLDKIQQLVQNMSWILADAVHYVHAASSNPQWVDLTEFVSEALANQTPSQQVELGWSEGSDTPLVAMDPGQAQHMTRVLLSMFRQFVRKDHPIRMAFYEQGEEAILACSSAAPEALCERCEDLLLPFTAHLPAGAGLALASVRRIAEAHGGRVRIHANNGVLTVEISLPAS